jgi:hypothetical protein
MNTEIFNSWFLEFLKMVKERPLILIFDGHKTHISLPLIKLGQDNQVSILKLPSHTTSLLQPLDVACFKPLKNAWDNRLLQFQRDNNFRQLGKSEMVDLICDVWNIGLNPANIKAGFLKTGIFPVDRNVYPTNLFHPVKFASYKATLVQQPVTVCTQTGSDIHQFPNTDAHYIDTAISPPSQMSAVPFQSPQSSNLQEV